MPLVLSLNLKNEIVLRTSDGDVVIRRNDYEDARKRWIKAPPAIEITRREKVH